MERDGFISAIYRASKVSNLVPVAFTKMLMSSLLGSNRHSKKSFLIKPLYPVCSLQRCRKCQTVCPTKLILRGHEIQYTTLLWSIWDTAAFKDETTLLVLSRVITTLHGVLSFLRDIENFSKSFPLYFKKNIDISLSLIVNKQALGSSSISSLTSSPFSPVTM